VPVNAVRAGFLGKLPASGDFVRHNASDPVVEALDAWLQEGLVRATEVLGAGWQAAFDTAPPAAYVFQPPGTGRFAAGAWVPSRDAAGRRYPFTIFLSGERPGPRGRSAPLAAACAGFLEEALGLALELRAGAEPKPPAQRADRLLPSWAEGLADPAAAHERFLEETTVEGFWKALLGSFESPARRAIASGLQEAARSAPRGKAARSAPGLKLPLPAASAATQALFAGAWADIVLRLGGGGAPPPLLYWSAGPRPALHDPARGLHDPARGLHDPARGLHDPAPGASLFVFPSGPHPRDFLPLVRPDDPGEHVWDLAAAGAGGAAGPAGPPALADPGLTLAQALGRLG
jgi:type VI secretion system protein ImpM